MTALVHLCHHLRRTNFKEPNVCTTFTEINQMVQNLFMGSRHTYTGIQSGTTAWYKKQSHKESLDTIININNMSTKWNLIFLNK